MINKIKQWLRDRRAKRDPTVLSMREEPVTYSEEHLDNAYRLGYNEGRRDGLSIARQQATKSLKEILTWQNQTKK